MSKYLYGASVQGIQEFIFKTNKLQEIVGASEIVKKISEDFKKFSKLDKKDILVNAAGNIKAIFSSKEDLQDFILDFSKHVEQNAFGITISQAVIEIKNEVQCKDELDDLIKKLKIQRNNPSIPLDMSFNIMELDPSTAKPIISYIKDKPLDISRNQKREANYLFYKENPSEIEYKYLKDLSNSKNKLAVIHADGNGLGELIPKLGDKLSEFSIILDECTREAFEYAKDESKIKKIREVILGGDDLTVICNADDALVFTKNFLAEFEKLTEDKLKHLLKDLDVSKKLTACAGIAFINEKYPFHYAVNLAESLCSISKIHAKNLRLKKGLDCVPSSLMFHNIQSSNFQTWDLFLENELTIRNNEETIKCDFGPYYLNEDGEVKISDFLNILEEYKKEGSPKTALRSWLIELYKSDISAKNLLSRINTITQEGSFDNEDMSEKLKSLYETLSNENLIVEKDDEIKTPIYDVLQILSITESINEA